MCTNYSLEYISPYRWCFRFRKTFAFFLTGIKTSFGYIYIFTDQSEVLYLGGCCFFCFDFHVICVLENTVGALRHIQYRNSFFIALDPSSCCFTMITLSEVSTTTTAGAKCEATRCRRSKTKGTVQGNFPSAYTQCSPNFL